VFEDNGSGNDDAYGVLKAQRTLQEPKPDQPNRPAGRKDGHKGEGRKKPDNIDVVEHQRLESCPDCSGALSDLGVGHHHTVEDIDVEQGQMSYPSHKTIIGRWEPATGIENRSQTPETGVTECPKITFQKYFDAPVTIHVSRY